MRAVTGLRRLWEAISEPRHLKAAYLGIYSLTVLVGLVTLIRPPQSIEGPLGAVLTSVWASAFIVGGLVGAVTVLPGWWWVERLLGTSLILIGLGMYASVVIVLHIQGLPTGGSRLTQLGVIALAASPFLLRFLLIREYSYEPRR